MIITVEKLKQYINTNKSDEVLEEQLLALETSIRKYTNNNFQNRNVRFMCNAVNGILDYTSIYLKDGDTVEVSNSTVNAGVYVIQSMTDYTITLDKPLYDEEEILVTKVEYPADVKMGVIEIMRWKLKNEEQNYDANATKDVQSETISRHSVTYAKDATESDISIEFGVPRKYVAFLNNYMKARF